LSVEPGKQKLRKTAVVWLPVAYTLCMSLLIFMLQKRPVRRA
jgi:hypothetical protein